VIFGETDARAACYHARMTRCTRRQALATLAAATAGALLPGRTWAASRADFRALEFAHLHTGERLAVEYCSGGRYVPDALAAVNTLLRDFRTGDVKAIDPALLDLLFDLQDATGAAKPFQVISGFRSPMTNAALRRRSHGVASGSLHMQGQAIDIRVADVPLTGLRRAAMTLRQGGVGYYPASNFVHVDTGRVRTW
jgi:uncharacterized protein YcbK (DUF882 family)